MKCSLGISNFLEEISSLSHSVVFPIFLCIDCWGRLFYLSLLFFGTLHSNGYIFPFLLCLSLVFFSIICKVSSENHFAFFHFFFFGMVLVTVSYTVLGTSIHSSSGTPSTRSSSLNLFWNKPSAGLKEMTESEHSPTHRLLDMVMGTMVRQRTRLTKPFSGSSLQT